MHWHSKLVQPQTLAAPGFKSLATPTHRGSTVLFDKQADVVDAWDQAKGGYSYGLYGTPTTLELSGRIAQLEGALHSFVVPGGQAAIALVYFALCQAGSHALVPHSAYGPNKEMAQGLLKGLGIDVEPYDPLIGAGIADLIRDNTALIWVESPGSVTMEIQDVPAICAAAHEKGALVAIDNTYAAGVLFDAFAHGVDINMQALTKYVGGHSDLLLGTVSVNSEALKQKVGATYKQLGLAVSPDDCSLALRGLQTLGLRLAHLEKSTLTVAEWLSNHPAVAEIFHPAFPSCPGHEIWKRDFTGSSSVFSFMFTEDYSAEQVEAFINTLEMFKIGMSWGGVTSLALVYPNIERPGKDYAGRLVRLNIGLEYTEELIADLDRALTAITR
ncbi:cystathionine beta-lyase [Photobacterium aphoticum]|uniref:Cystathionine beta-lyase n=1 Tax=Photobacterium aphoticum TaxID=754436 RepID=A0A0J1GNQ5_9GAMM|nr:cystathionine beta-lyase [Photobacterium aphoticum]KLV01221.1 cystathionine beta-lyase [Photobacterium aphoticum]PSU57019.1 cystathionine beta-lyase [Photobacterium aphoticum]GHA49888.1 cystathionine beta-lyase [Photobacterium aphoticum]